MPANESTREGGGRESNPAGYILFMRLNQIAVIYSSERASDTADPTLQYNNAHVRRCTTRTAGVRIQLPRHRGVLLLDDDVLFLVGFAPATEQTWSGEVTRTRTQTAVK